jgi:hypothetical protein
MRGIFTPLSPEDEQAILLLCKLKKIEPRELVIQLLKNEIARVNERMNLPKLLLKEAVESGKEWLRLVKK